MTYRRKMTLPEVRKALVADSLQRKKLVDRLVELVREDERNRVIGIQERARRQER